LIGFLSGSDLEEDEKSEKEEEDSDGENVR